MSIIIIIFTDTASGKTSLRPGDFRMARYTICESQLFRIFSISFGNSVEQEHSEERIMR
jgi:hypothetical protein